MDFLRQWIGILLVLAGLARAGLVVLHEPVAGYANNYDMHRTSACIGLFPAKEGAAQAATPDAPLSVYAVGSRTEGCYQSSEVVLVATAVAIARATGTNPAHVKLQWIGYVKLALLFATAFMVAWLLRDHPGAGAVHGLLVLLVLADPVVTLWFNTLYTEFAAIWAIYAVIAAAAVLALYDRMSLLSWALLVAGTVVLAFSREQFALLGPAMVLAAWPWLWHASQRLTVVALVVALVASAASLWVVPRPLEVQKANRANSYLGVLMPASSSAARAAAILGLPESCAALSGATWEKRRAEIEKGCPQVFALSRFAFTRFASDEPEALARAAARALPAVHGVAPERLGTMSEQPGKTIDDMPWWGFSPLRFLDAQLPPAAIAILTLAAFLVAPLALVSLLALRRWRGDPLAPLLLAMLAGGTAIYSYITMVFGAGAARHDIVGALAAYVLVLAVIAGIPTLALRWKRTPREAMLEVGVGAVAIALGIYAGWLAAGWIAAQAASPAPAPAVVPAPAAPPGTTTTSSASG